MSLFRRLSATRLLALIAAVVAVAAGGTAIALAAGGGGPKPPPKPLARAIHDALRAPAPAGVTAQIRFTNHLIDSASLIGGDPVLTGARGRLWLSDRGRLRLELQSDRGDDAQLVVDGRSFWLYDASAGTVFRGTLPTEHGQRRERGRSEVPGVAAIQRALNGLARAANLSTARPTDVAGRPAYSVRVAPAHDGGLLGAGEVAWDAARGVPLRVGVYAQGGAKPVLELAATDISYGPVPASAFDVAPPKGAKVVTVAAPAGASGKRAHQRPVEGERAVRASLPFALAAPRALVGLPRQTVKRVDWGGEPAALVTYGRGLGGLLVIERPDHGDQAPSAPGGGEHRGRQLDLPQVSIAGATGRELATALGTVLTWNAGGVSYTVLGSVPPAAAEAAARALAR